MAKTVLITGAGVRVGRALAVCLAGGGWDIAVHYRSSGKDAADLVRRIEQKKRRATLVQADLSDAAEAAKIIPTLARKGVKLDALVNCAAEFEKDNLATLNEQSWDRHMRTNVLAPLLLMRDFAAQYKGEGGIIVNVTDGMKGWSLSEAFLSYALSKLALGNVTKLLARELAPRIRVNAVAPGAMLEGKHDKKGTYEKLRKVIPLARTSSVQEMCDAVCYLFNAPSVTGQTLWLSGGMQLT